MDELTQCAIRAAKGDPAAQTAFVRASQADVWRLCSAMAGRDLAEDLTQESYLRAFKALPSFEARSSVRTWLLGIARRVCADHVRSAVRQRALGHQLEHRAAASAPDPATFSTANDLVAGLSGDQRAAFVLTQLVGLPYQEAAEVEGVPVGTIRSRVARARTELITALNTAAAS